MPDGAPTEPTTPTGTADDAAERATLATEARLVRNVRLRLVAWSGLTTLLVLVALGAALYVVAARTLEARGLDQLENRANSLRGFRPDRDDSGGLGFIFGGGSSGTFAMVVDENGRQVGRREFRIPSGLPVLGSVEAARTGSGPDVRLAEVGRTPVRVRTEQVQTSIGPVYLQVLQDRTTEQNTLNAILTVLLVGGAIVVLVAIGFGTVYARRALVPIRDSLAAQRAALGRQREFAADASHELRTPLTVIRSSLEHLRRHRDKPVRAVGDALDDIDAEVDHLTSLVDDLLLLARSDSGAVSLARLPVDLGDVAAEAASSLRKPAEDKGIRVVVDPAPAVVVGDGARLRQLVMILVDNAIRHSPTGSEVRVAVRADGRSAVLDVEDQGGGIRSEDLGHVFERFWRAPGAPQGGTGLGLAIAKWIVERHDGSINVTNREQGGARFRVALPAGDGLPA